MNLLQILRQLLSFIMQSALYGGAAFLPSSSSSGDLIIRGLSIYVENGKTYYEEDQDNPEFFGLYLRTLDGCHWKGDYRSYSEAMEAAKALSRELKVRFNPGASVINPV